MRAVAKCCLGLLLLAGAASCSAGGQQGKSPRGGASQAGACAASGARALRAVGRADVGGTIALADRSGRTLALVADEDARAVLAIDLASRRTLASLALQGRPSQLLLLDDGRLVVAHRDKNELVIAELAGEKLESLCTVPTASEPVALALGADDSTVFVSSAWGHALGVYRSRDFAKQREIDLPREPRAVAISSDGKTAFVAHAVGGHASAVDLASGRVHRVELRGQPNAMESRTRRMVLEAAAHADHDEDLRAAGLGAIDDSKRRTSCQGFALAKSSDPVGRVLAPQVLVDPGDATRRSTGYGDDTMSTEVASVAVLDDRTQKPLPISLESLERGAGVPMHDADTVECLLPRAAVVDKATRTLLVACLGIDRIVGYDAAAASPARAVKRVWRVPSGPTGVALEPGRSRAVVWSQFDRSLSFVPLATDVLEDPDREPRKLARIALPELQDQTLSDKARLGRMLFHATGDPRVARDGRACASCHPDGRDDGLVWATPNGPRRSVMLAGRLRQTAPFSWEGEHVDLEQHVEKTFERLNGIGGLRSVELDALIAYIESLPAPPPAQKVDHELVLRGRQLFASAETGCSRCHAGSRFTDNARHDVASSTSGDRVHRFNTPSLAHLSGRGPWFHDGRFQTLRELLVKSDGKMGRTRHLSPRDLDALEAYLASL